MALRDKQVAFINEYLKHFNATKAAIDAGYSPKTAYNIGWENVRKREIAEAISRRLSETAMGPEEVMMRLADHARGDIRDFLAVSRNGDVTLDISAAEGKTHLVKKVTQRHSTRTTKDSVTEDVTLTLELHDAQAALVAIGKHHKLFTEKVEHGGETLLRVVYDDKGSDDPST